MSIDEQRIPILATARELYGRVVYSHKTHEQEREIWSKKVCQMNRLACRRDDIFRNHFRHVEARMGNLCDCILRDSHHLFSNVAKQF
jgi:hypothetical protein